MNYKTRKQNDAHRALVAASARAQDKQAAISVQQKEDKNVVDNGIRPRKGEGES